MTKIDGQVGSGNVLRVCALGGCRFVLEKGAGKSTYHLVTSHRTCPVRELEANWGRFKNAESWRHAHAHHASTTQGGDYHEIQTCALGASATMKLGCTPGVFTMAEARAFLAENQLAISSH